MTLDELIKQLQAIKEDQQCNDYRVYISNRALGANLNYNH
jgi:hypothetical protein